MTDYSTRRVAIVVTSKMTADSFLPPIVRAFQDTGCCVTLAADVAPDARLFSGKTKFVAMGFRRDPHPIADLLSLVRVAWFLSRTPWDLVIVATPKATLHVSLCAHLIRGLPVVALAWGLRHETLSGWRARLLARLEMWSLRRPRLIVANSRSLARRIAAIQPRYERKTVVPLSGSSHGVDIKRFSSSGAVSRREGSEFTIGYVGRINRDKGLTYLADALAMASDLTEARLTLAAYGWNEDQSVLDYLRAKSEHKFEFQWHGPTNVSAKTFEKMDILCLPSLREGFPNVILEAGACGIPTVTTDATGCRDAVIEGFTGLVVPKRNLTELASAIVTLESNEDLRLELGRNAREWTAKNFDQRLVCSALAAACLSVARARP